MAFLTTLSGQPIAPLGLASQSLQSAQMVEMAWEAGVNYFFSYSLPSEVLQQGLKPLLARQRDQVCIAIGSESRQIHQLKETIDRTRQLLDLETIDVFFAEYISPTDTDAEIAAMFVELQQWKTNGQIRYLGASTHNRSIAQTLIHQNQLDVLMLRYNMAHRKIEQDVLPLAQSVGLPIVAFTCTRWGTLLKGHPQWQSAPPTAADCYRYALHHPAVQIALTAPATPDQLQQNLSVLQTPDLTEADRQHWQTYGDLIYGNGQDAFETQWI